MATVHEAANRARNEMIAGGVNCGEIQNSTNRHGEASAYFSACILIGKRFAKANVRVSDHECNRSFSMADAFFFYDDAKIEEKASDLAQRMIASASKN